MMKPRLSLFSILRTALLCGIVSGLINPLDDASAGSAVDEAEAFLDLSLEDLSQVVVTSASRKAQPLADTPAAVFVISAEDIRRSGATNLPEALRLAPGVQVAALGNSKWAVSIRGFADRYSNKLLVLMDGRSLYSPLFSGALWEAQNIPLEIIERIEVIRGPAPLWGANAVNGVINIITQSAKETLGGQAVIAAGSELRADGFVRQGWQVNDETAVRVYAKGQDYGSSRLATGGENVDDWQNGRIGVRLDRHAGTDHLFVEGEIYHSQSSDRVRLPLTTGQNGLADVNQTWRGGYLLSRWERETGPNAGYTMQAYLEQQQHPERLLSAQDIDTFDLEFQQRLAIGEQQDMIWGLGYRRISDHITDSAYIIADPAKRTSHLFSAYLQDDITLADRWRLTLGSRFDHNDYTGFEVQPNVRLLWAPNAHTRIWAAVSRVVRTPSRMDSDGRFWLANAPLGALVQPLPPSFDPDQPVAIILQGNSDFDTERMTGLDVGWRQQWSSTLSLDVAGFYYDYDQLRSVSSSLDFSNPSAITVQQLMQNANDARLYGLELAADWRPDTDWRLQASYSWVNKIGRGDSLAFPPTHQFSLLSTWAFQPAWQWDVWLRYVSAIEDPGYATPAYANLDMRLAWKIQRDLEVSLVGQNLFDQSHPEFASQYIQALPTEIERGVYLKLDVKF
ncbi:MAG: TonB-dependent receptor [Candidatus Competibacteraceae bacterium]|nr:TonB-dependent receptor [Candidatus Competibacteraceae bacterium]